MSQQNVKVLQAAFEAWNAGDMDAFRELLDPDVEGLRLGGLVSTFET